MNEQLTKAFTTVLEKEGIGESSFAAFIAMIHDYYLRNARPFPWRETHDPYEILVSEIMLQQTQTDRVVPKYEQFLAKFPTADALAKGKRNDVLILWQGLGYNRRAIALHESAKKCVAEFEGQFPDDRELLQMFPGIGPYTSAAVCTFAFNQPLTFIETNIRTVFLHYFFPGKEGVEDAALMPLIEATVDQDNPREWYYALMDIGSKLNKLYKKPNRRSKHYAKQSKFEGSNRQIRGLILKHLVAREKLTKDAFFTLIERKPEDIQKNLTKMTDEGFLAYHKGYFTLQEQ